MNLICGINPVLEALGAGTRHFDRLLVVKGTRNRRVSEAIARASQKGVPLRFEARETLDRMAGGVPHQGVIAVVSEKPMLSLESLLDEAREPALILLLDGVEDPRNLGAILRTAECAGAAGVVLPERHSAGLSETVARASAGALEYMKVARIGNVAQAVDTLKARGVWVVGFDAEGTERWDHVDLKRPVALVLGGEGKGIRRLVRERCDHLVSLPLFGHVSSLNVSVAAGIALYEVIRQRGAIPSHVKPIPMRRVVAPEPIVGPAPDDIEADPGASRRPTPEPVAVNETDEHDGPESLVAIPEEAAWSGPALIAPREDRRGRPRPVRDWAARPEGGESQSQSHTEPRTESGRRHRRRRRGGRHEGQEGQGSEAHGGSNPGSQPPRPPQQQGPESGVPVSNPGGEGGAPPSPNGPEAPGRRHGRRRRRRHRH